MPKCDFNFIIEVLLRHGCSPVNLLHIFRTRFPKNTSGGLLLKNLDSEKITKKITDIFYLQVIYVKALEHEYIFSKYS